MLNAKPTQVQFGAISYGMDYLDPTNMLGIWLFGGRHSWQNDEFDGLINEATSLVDDPAKREPDVPVMPKRFWLMMLPVSSCSTAGKQPSSSRGCKVTVFAEPDNIGIKGEHWGNDSCVANRYTAKH